MDKGPVVDRGVSAPIGKPILRSYDLYPLQFANLEKIFSGHAYKLATELHSSTKFMSKARRNSNSFSVRGTKNDVLRYCDDSSSSAHKHHYC